MADNDNDSTYFMILLCQVENTIRVPNLALSVPYKGWAVSVKTQKLPPASLLTPRLTHINIFPVGNNT